MKALGTAHHREVEVGGVPGPITEKPGSMSSTEGRYTMMSWRHVRVEVVGCGRICEVDAASRLFHHTVVVCSKNSASRSIDKFGCRTVNVRLECRPNAEKDDQKVINPVLTVGF